MATAVSESVKTYQLYIDGEWRDATGGETFPSINPSNDEVIANVAKGTREDAQAAIAAARRSFDRGEWADQELPRSAATSCSRPASTSPRSPSSATGRRSSRPTPASPCAWPTSPTCPSALEHFRSLAAPGRRDQGVRAAAVGRHAGGGLELRQPRAPGRLRPDHPLELPPHDGLLEAGAGAGHRQLGDPQARVQHLPDGAGAGQGAGRDRALPQGRHQHRHRPRRGGRRGARLAPRRRQGRLHGQHRGRAPDHAAGQRHGQEGDPGAGRQVGQHHPARRRPRPRHRRLAVRDLLAPGPGLRVGHPPAGPREPCTTRSSSA